MTEMEEEESGEEGTFFEWEKVNRVTVSSRLKDLKGDKEATTEEVAVLTAWLKLSSQEAEVSRALRETEADLDAKAYSKYPTLTENEIRALVVDDKWLAALDSAIHVE